MKLISATPSPYARKVRVALAEKGISFELLTEVPWNDDTTLPRHNPLEKLPVLIPDGGEPVYQSSYILEWLERRHPDPPLLPPDDDGILAHKRLEVIADGVCDAVILILFERMRPVGAEPAVDRPPGAQDPRRRRRAGGSGGNAPLRGSRPLRPRRRRDRQRARLPRRALRGHGLARRAPGSRGLRGRVVRPSLFRRKHTLRADDPRQGGMRNKGMRDE